MERLRAAFRNSYVKPEDADIRWSFITYALQALHELKSSMLEASSVTEKDVMLSIKQQKDVSVLLQMISAFGIIPFIVPGIGPPIEKRSKFVKYLVGPLNRDDFDYPKVIPQ